jgi:uncharacterized protein YkwD
MKNKLCSLFVIVVLTWGLNSCSKNDDNDTPTVVEIPTNSIYSSIELEVIKLVNDHRTSIGLSALIKNDYISSQTKEHTNYMINNNILNHANFETRVDNIKKTLGSGSPAENVAMGYSSAKDVLDGWLRSSGHKQNIEGDHKLFGIGIKANAKGELYYTMFFY